MVFPPSSKLNVEHDDVLFSVSPLDALPNICVFGFASGGGDYGPGVPHFEFARTLNHLKVDYFLFRDSTEQWYTNGVLGLGSQQEVVDHIVSQKRLYKRVITLGLSSGAYAALMYGQLAAVNEIIAISPLTVLGPQAEKEFGPDWAHRVRLPIDFSIPIDLKPLFKEGPITKVRAFVTDGDGSELDRQMAERIEIDDITLISGFTHGGLARGMIDQGLLQAAIIG